MKRLLLSSIAALGLSAPVAADVDVAAMTAADRSERCVTLMSGFPDDGAESRYVFFRLSQELAKDITPELAATMAEYMAANEARRLPADFPMMDVVEDIADPVLRQAAPEKTVAGMAHFAYFDALCSEFVGGQVQSLAAFDPSLAEGDLYIREDALYLRQLLAEALDRLGGGAAVEAYSESLVTERDDIEFTGFEGDVGDLEALYMGDLDTKLATANDMVNEGLDAEIYQDSVSMAKSMDATTADTLRRERLNTLCQILTGCRIGY